MHRCFAEGEHHLAEALGQPLAGTHIERNSLPAPVVDKQLHGDVGLRGAVRIDARFLAVPRKGGVMAAAGAVLTADAAVPGLLLIGQSCRLQHLGLFVADRFRIKATRRFHGCDGQHLGEVVLHHVPQGAGGLVIPGPLLDPDRFGCGDLNTRDVVPVPDRFENGVGEAQHHDVLDGLLAQVVVDSEDLVLLATALHDAFRACALP